MAESFYKKWLRKLRKKYRVEVLDEFTYSQLKAYYVSPLKLILIGLSLSLIVILSTSSFIAFIPGVRKHIPDCIDPAEKEQKNALLEKVVILEENLNALQLQNSSMRKALKEGGIDLGLAESELARVNGPEPMVSVPSEVVSDGSSAYSPTVENTGASNYAVKTTFSLSPLLNLFPPVSAGEISNTFNEAEKHYGVDIVAEENELVRAVADGFVILAEYHVETGQVIGISSTDNIVTFFKHNSLLYKKVGDYVKAGESIAVMGNSGENSTGPHLHFELWHEGKPIDPMKYITF